VVEEVEMVFLLQEQEEEAELVDTEIIFQVQQ
jgi:hypothetical protein